MEPGQVVGIIVVGLLAIFIIVAIARAVRIVPQAVALIVERLGRYHSTMYAGLHFLIPFVDRVRADDRLHLVITRADLRFARHAIRIGRAHQRRVRRAPPSGVDGAVKVPHRQVGRGAGFPGRRGGDDDGLLD